MASVRELVNTWQLRFYDSRRDPPQTEWYVSKEIVPTEAQARKEAEYWEHEYKYNGGPDPWTRDYPGHRPGALTVPEAVEKFIEHKKAAAARGEQGGWSKATLNSKKYILRGFAEHCGPISVHDLTTRHVRGYLRDSGLAPATQKGYRRAIRAMARWWDREGMREHLKMPPARETVKKIQDTVTRKELEKICKKHIELQEEKRQKKHASPKLTGTDWMADVWRFAFEQGLRRGEIMDLRVRDVIKQEGRWMVKIVETDERRPKGRKERIVALTKRAQEVVARFIEGKSPSERIFGRKSGYKVSDAFRAARKKVYPGRDDLNFHSLRHSFARRILEKTGDIYRVSKMLGHSSVRVTQSHYEHFMPETTGGWLEDIGE